MSEYTSVRIDEVKPGDRLVPDDAFDCLEEGVPVEVRKDEDGLYVCCADGSHYLDGQLDFDSGEFLIGFRRATERD